MTLIQIWRSFFFLSWHLYFIVLFPNNYFIKYHTNYILLITILKINFLNLFTFFKPNSPVTHSSLTDNSPSNNKKTSTPPRVANWKCASNYTRNKTAPKKWGAHEIVEKATFNRHFLFYSMLKATPKKSPKLFQMQRPIKSVCSAFCFQCLSTAKSLSGVKLMFSSGGLVIERYFLPSKTGACCDGYLLGW